MSNILFNYVLETTPNTVSSNIETSSNYTVTEITSGSLKLESGYGSNNQLLSIVWLGTLEDTPMFLNINSPFTSSVFEFPIISIDTEVIRNSLNIAYNPNNNITTLTTSSNSSLYFRNNNSLGENIQLIYHKSVESISEHTPSKFLQFATGSFNELDFLIVSKDNDSFISSSLLLSSSLVLSQSLSTQLSSVDTKLTAVSSSYLAASQSLSTQVSSSNSIISKLVSVIDDTSAADSKLGLSLSGVWNETTPPSGSSLTEEQKGDWGNGNIPIIRNANRDGQPVFGILGDPDGFLQVRLKNDNNNTDYIIFLPYYSSSYSP